MKSPRILCVEAYPGFRGAQRSLAALLVGLREDTTSAPHLAVLCLAAGRAAEGYDATGVPVHVLEPPESLQSYGGRPCAAPPPKAFGVVLAAFPAWFRLDGEAAALAAARRP